MEHGTLKKLGTRMALVATVAAAATPSAFAQHDAWYAYAVARQADAVPTFVTDTLAPGGTGTAVGYRFTTDTLAPGGTGTAVGYRFTTDTLAPGGGIGGPVASAPSAFHWRDAGIGAASVLAALMALGAIRMQRRHRLATT